MGVSAIAESDAVLTMAAESIERARLAALDHDEPLALRLILAVAELEQRSEESDLAARLADDPRERIEAARGAWTALQAAARVRRLVGPGA